MDIQFLPNNTHLKTPNEFRKTDPHLIRLYAEPYVYHSPLIDELPRQRPGILTLGGGRQIGKSTLLKQWMENLLQHGVPPQAICFYSGELIHDHQQLYKLMIRQLETMPKNTLNYFILDEVTDIKEWDKAVKYLADTGALANTLLVLTGSDLVLIEEARKRFPGRRGKLDKVNFHYYPLSFREFLTLKKKLQNNQITITLQELYDEFEQYLIHGGFLSAINDYAATQQISIATLETYSDWIRGDVLKRNKNETFLQEIIEAIIKHYMKQISWDNLVKELSIDHTQTIANYIHILESMDAVFVQSAIIEDKLKPAPKKRKKVMFCDPFIFHAMKFWIEPSENPYENQITPLLSNPELYADLVEACVTTHFRRFFPTYYIKAEGEIDIAYVHQKRFWPIEIKWRNQLRPSDLKQICKYPNAEIYSKVVSTTQINHVPIRPLPLALLEIDELGKSSV